MNDFTEPRNQTAPPPVPPPPGMTPEMQRGLTMAILQAHPNCCDTCTKLAPLQELLFQQLEQGSSQVPTPAMNAGGERYELPPIERPTWPNNPTAAPSLPTETPAFSH